MLKKVISITLSLCLISSVIVMAENANAVSDETVPEVSEQIPHERDKMRMPPMGDMQDTNQDIHAEQETSFLGFVKTYSTPITSVILLFLAFIFVIFYRRKNY